MQFVGEQSFMTEIATVTVAFAFIHEATVASWMKANAIFGYLSTTNSCVRDSEQTAASNGRSRLHVSSEANAQWHVANSYLSDVKGGHEACWTTKACPSVKMCIEGMFTDRFIHVRLHRHSNAKYCMCSDYCFFFWRRSIYLTTSFEAGNEKHYNIHNVICNTSIIRLYILWTKR